MRKIITITHANRQVWAIQVAFALPKIIY